MRSMTQLAAIALLGTVCVLTVKRQDKEIGLLLAMATGSVLLFSVTEGCIQILDTIKLLADAAGIESELLSPLLKTVGISIVTGLSAQVCRDAGESSIAAAVQLTGGFSALYVSLPLIRAVLDLLTEVI